MLKKLRDMLTHRRIAEERNRALRARFGRSLEELKGLFSRPLDMVRISATEKRPSRYPEISSLLPGTGINAFYAHFQLESNKVHELIEGIKNGFDKVDEHLYIRRSGNEAGDFFISIAFSNEFSGSIVSMMTNDTSVLDRIVVANSSPPPPWVAFPEISEPLKLGFLQGDIEYWWDNYWSSFWESLTAEEREAYLGRHGATEEWKRCIWLHGREARELLESALSEKDQG
ncbi:hypothetical protein [Cupriavidus sp. GA3-3]|uniref:hypothetical protein n=1 Tax=Cupriavidus sp. GA3-3 TaxID=1229514 RepID=UPI001184369A|nr:hypothetical protein [Cupriavidus sp. GA3-3]